MSLGKLKPGTITKGTEIMITDNERARLATELDKAGRALRRASRVLLPPEPEPEPIPVLTASNRVNPWIPHAEAFAVDEGFVGQELDGFHGYSPGMPEAWADHVASRVTDRPRAMANVKGLDPISTPDEFVRFASTVPAGTYLLLNHEADNPSKGIDPARYREVFALTWEAFTAARLRGEIAEGVTLWINPMSYLWRAGDGREPADWIPRTPTGDLAADGVLLNGYWSEATPAFDEIFGPALRWLNVELGPIRWGIGEIGIHTPTHIGQKNGGGVVYPGPVATPTEAHAWVIDTLTAAADQGAEVIVWFSSPVGPRGPWWIDEFSGPAIAEWRGDR